MPKDKINAVQNMQSILNANKTNGNAKVEINGKTFDEKELADALSAGKLKGKVKVDLDGDGIFDKQISARKLAKTDEKNLFGEIKDTSVNSSKAKELAGKLNEIDEKLAANPDKAEKKAIDKNQNMILNTFRKGGISAEDVVALQNNLKAKNTEPPKPEAVKTDENPIKEEPQVQKEAGFLYKVQKGDSPEEIAARLGIKGDEINKWAEKLVKLNEGTDKNSTQTFKGKTTGKDVKGFLSGATIKLPEGYTYSKDFAFKDTAPVAEKKIEKGKVSAEKHAEAVKHNSAKHSAKHTAEVKKDVVSKKDVASKKHVDKDVQQHKVATPSDNKTKSVHPQAKENPKAAHPQAKSPSPQDVTLKKSTLTKDKSVTKKKDIYSDGSIKVSYFNPVTKALTRQLQKTRDGKLISKAFDKGKIVETVERNKDGSKVKTSGYNYLPHGDYFYKSTIYDKQDPDGYTYYYRVAHGETTRIAQVLYTASFFRNR